MDIRISIDSGAFGLFMKHGLRRQGIAHSDFSYFRSPEFEQYFERYCIWLKENKAKLAFYVSLDVIFNPQMSWQLYLRLRERGFAPMPVLHYGEGLDWLKKYLPDCQYIGVGGVGGRQCSARQYVEWADQVFKMFGKEHRAHGFAISQQELVDRYNWFSVDSTTPWQASAYGSVLIPQAQKMRGQYKFNFNTHPFAFSCTPRKNNQNMVQYEPAYREAAQHYVESLGQTVPDLATSGIARSIVSYITVARCFEALRKRTGRSTHFYVSGAPSGLSKALYRTLFKTLVPYCSEYNYMGNFLEPSRFRNICNSLENLDENQNPTRRPQSRRPCAPS